MVSSFQAIIFFQAINECLKKIITSYVVQNSAIDLDSLTQLNMIYTMKRQEFLNLIWSGKQILSGKYSFQDILFLKSYFCLSMHRPLAQRRYAMKYLSYNKQARNNGICGTSY